MTDFSDNWEAGREEVNSELDISFLRPDIKINPFPPDFPRISQTS